MRDCTERRRAESELRSREATDRAQEKLATLGRVAGGVAQRVDHVVEVVDGLPAGQRGVLAEGVDGGHLQLVRAAGQLERDGPDPVGPRRAGDPPSLVADATRFDMLKKPTTAEMSQMSRSVKPARRRTGPTIFALLGRISGTGPPTTRGQK